MLDQETGLRGFALNKREDFLEPYVGGRADFQRALRSSKRDLADDATGNRLILRQERIAKEWQSRAATTVAALHKDPESSIPFEDAAERKKLMDRFRDENAKLQSHLESRRREMEGRARNITILAILGLGAIFGAAGVIGLRRSRRRREALLETERAYATSQSEFRDLMQVASDETEARELLQRHLKRSATGAVTVLSTNNSDNRLEARTQEEVDPILHDRLERAEPRSCLAIRMSSMHVHDGDRAGHQPLVTCDLCADSPAICVPLQASGQVIGSVLVNKLGHGEVENNELRRRIDESVAVAAPALANLRNLALAELRAASDALTGLPNRRSLELTLARMLAEAQRHKKSLALLVIDLDHFKQINDQFGHSVGDAALAVAGQTLEAALRSSDFVARFGGEEFVVLLPETDTVGATKAAENLREAIERAEVAGLPRGLTASIGGAVFPKNAHDADSLLRKADHTLYEAKSAGRNRVEMAPEAPVTS